MVVQVVSGRTTCVPWTSAGGGEAVWVLGASQTRLRKHKAD